MILLWVPSVTHTSSLGLSMQVRLVFYIKLLAILHLCNAAPEEYDQIWDFHQIYPPPYPIFVTDATDDVCVVL